MTVSANRINATFCSTHLVCRSSNRVKDAGFRKDWWFLLNP